MIADEWSQTDETRSGNPRPTIGTLQTRSRLVRSELLEIWY